jgi:hypothetical protein
MPRRISALLATGAAACVAAGTAQAATIHTGWMTNGGCDPAAQLVQVSGPSRIDAEISSTSAVPTSYVAIVGSDGAVLASGAAASYDTPGTGEYYVRACSWYSHIDPLSLVYTSIFATGPAGQPALPHVQAELAASRALSPTAASGSWFIAR